MDNEEITLDVSDESENIVLDVNDKTNDINISFREGEVTVINNFVIHRGTTGYWNSKINYISKKDELYVYTDATRKVDPVTGEVKYFPELKIGDGLAYLIDMPFIGGGFGTDISIDDIMKWNNKWRGYVETRLDENILVFTTD